MRSIVKSLDRFGVRFGLGVPHRLAQYITQLAHESGRFRYDREVWGPTPAQRRYEGRKDLGNTQPGDGSKFRGRTPIQITGRANTTEFRDWCREKGVNPPDFVEKPGLMNTDPWEGLGPIWYWETRKLNRYADSGDIEQITKRINGGLNGYADRLECYTVTALVLLGYPVTAKRIMHSIKAFQAVAQDNGWLPKDRDGAPSQIDGDAGPKTRTAMHMALVAAGGAIKSGDVRAAPGLWWKAKLRCL